MSSRASSRTPGPRSSHCTPTARIAGKASSSRSGSAAGVFCGLSLSFSKSFFDGGFVSKAGRRLTAVSGASGPGGQMFIALQDVHADMGGTIVLLGSNTPKAFNALASGGPISHRR